MTSIRRRSTDISPDKDAFTQPRRVAEGCTHDHVACRCETPFWLRPATPAELKRYRKPGKDAE